jgi:hypothetical protein
MSRIPIIVCSHRLHASSKTASASPDQVGSSSAYMLVHLPYIVLRSSASRRWTNSAVSGWRNGWPPPGPAANVNHLIGALIVIWAVIAFGEIVRPIRLLNIVWVSVS